MDGLGWWVWGLGSSRFRVEVQDCGAHARTLQAKHLRASVEWFLLGFTLFLFIVLLLLLVSCLFFLFFLLFLVLLKSKPRSAEQLHCLIALLHRLPLAAIEHELSHLLNIALIIRIGFWAHYTIVIIRNPQSNIRTCLPQARGLEAGKNLRPVRES